MTDTPRRSPAFHVSRRHAMWMIGGSAASLGYMTSGDFAAAQSLAETAPTFGPEDMIVSHGYSFYGNLAYPKDFEQLRYVNVDAPKGGEIALWAPGTFDSMNPYTRKGRAGRYSWVTGESLMGEMPFTGASVPADEYGEQYGLVAHTVEYPRTKDWAIFHIREEARFADGTPLRAEDVIFTHNLFLEQGLPSYAQAVKQRIPEAEVLDDLTVKFYFTPGISRRSLVSQVGATPIFSQRWFDETGARLDESRLEPAMGSGAYTLAEYDINRRIVWERNPDYWAKDLPINRGRFNYDRVRVEYFADDNAAFEAFKAGEYTFRPESNSRTWATGYDFRAVESGAVKRETIPNLTPPTPTGFVFNLLKEKFQDRRVREAMQLAFNFEWTNASLQYGLFAQITGFSQNSEIEAKGVPEGAERALLEGLGDIVPPELLTEEVITPHTSDVDSVVDRRNKRRALRLMAQAGWEVADDGRLRNAAGEPFTVDFILSSSSSATAQSIAETYISNLQDFGFEAVINRIDPAQFTLRRREKQYDMISASYISFLGTGTGLMQRFGSETAEVSVFNPASLASPLVDAVIDISLDADNRADEVTALTALDRALRYERMMVLTSYVAESWYAYYDMFEHPEDLPIFADGPLDFWWFNQEKFEALRASGALR
jgi:microcin C transport system substrate-binding protein